MLVRNSIFSLGEYNIFCVNIFRRKFTWNLITQIEYFYCPYHGRNFAISENYGDYNEFDYMYRDEDRVTNDFREVIAAANDSNGRLHVFVINSNNQVAYKMQLPNGSWSNWSNLDGWVSSIAVQRSANGRLAVFGIGRDNALWYRMQTQQNSWSNWQTLGGWINQLAVASNSDGRLEAFGRGRDGALWHTWQTRPNGGWSGWNSLGEELME